MENSDSGSVDVNAIVQSLNAEAAPAAEVAPEAPAAEAAPEAPEVKPEEPKKEEDPFSKKFAALSKRERMLKQKEAQINKRMQELEARLKSVEAPKAEEVKKPNIPIERRLRENPLETLKELGLSYEKLTQLALNDGQVPVEDRLTLMKEELEAKHQAEIEAIRNELIERDKKSEEQKYKEVVENFMAELTDFVNTSPDYELIRANDAVDVVYEVIEQHHSKTGKILSHKEAADHVESHLLQEAQKLLKLKKLGYKEPVPAPEKKASSQPVAPTLSNDASASLSNKVAVDVKSDEELKKIAASMLRWE